MTASQAVIGYGVKFQKGNGAGPEVFSDIGELRDPGNLDIVVDAVDVTHSQSSDGAREFIPGLRNGTYTCSLALIPGGATLVAIEAALRVKGNWRILFANANSTCWTFAAMLTNVGQAMPIDGEQVMALTFQISGKPTLSNLA